MLADAYLRGIMSHVLSDKMMADAPEGYLDYPVPRWNFYSLLIPLLWQKIPIWKKKKFMYWNFDIDNIVKFPYKLLLSSKVLSSGPV